MTERETFTHVLDERLDHVLKSPQGWGGVDALEPLVLMLLMLRAEFSAPSLPRAEVLRQYRRFLAQRISPGAGDLRERLGGALSLESMVEVLRAYVDMVRARTERVPQSSSPTFPTFQSIEYEEAAA